MLNNLTPQAQEAAIRMYAAQQGGRGGNMNAMRQQLMSNPQAQQAAVNLYMNNQASTNDRGGSGTVGSRIDDFVDKSDGNVPAPAKKKVAAAPAKKAAPTKTTQLPPRRPKELEPQEDPNREVRRWPKTPDPSQPAQPPAQDDSGIGYGGLLATLLGLRAVAGKNPGTAVGPARQQPVEDLDWRYAEPQGQLSTFDKAMAGDPDSGYLPGPAKQLTGPAEAPEPRTAAPDEVIRAGPPAGDVELPRRRVPMGRNVRVTPRL
jgi:hypothetical protein